METRMRHNAQTLEQTQYIQTTEQMKWTFLQFIADPMFYYKFNA